MDLNDDKELFSYVITQQTNCEFSLCSLLQKDADSWKYWFSILKLIKKGTRKPIKLDYGKYVFEDQIMALSKGLDIISNIFSKNNEGKGNLIIPTYDSFELELSFDFSMTPSKHEHRF